MCTCLYYNSVGIHIIIIIIQVFIVAGQGLSAVSVLANLINFVLLERSCRSIVRNCPEEAHFCCFYPDLLFFRMSKAYFTLGNTYCLARGKKDALVMVPASGADARCTAINRASGAERLGPGKRVFVTLELSDQVYVLDPSKKATELIWAKLISLSDSQSFKVNMLDDRPFAVGGIFCLSYKTQETKLTKYLSFGQGAEPLPILSESCENVMRLTITDIVIGDDDSGSEESNADVARPPGPQQEPYSPTVPATELGIIEEGVTSRKFVVSFMNGTLGVKLKRSTQGELIVQDIVPNSQAVNKGINIGDKFCKIGDKDVGDHPVDDIEFNSIVSMIKTHPRPLPITFEKSGAASATLTDVVESTPAVEPQRSHDPLPQSHQDAAVLPEEVSQPTLQDVDDLKALQRLADRLLVSPAGRSSVSGGLAGFAASISKSRNLSAPENMDAMPDLARKESFVLVQAGRRIIKHGELDVVGHGALWNVKYSKYFFLLSDVILVTSLKGKNFQLESILDHKVCKFDLAPIDSVGAKPDPMRFDIRWPGGIVEVCFKDESEREMWVRALSDAVCSSVFSGRDTLSFGWRHIYIHGTLHAAVLSRDERIVRSIITACEEGTLDISILDAKDEDMYTPLHFACILRQPRIAEILLNSHVDCTIPDGMGRTAFHWCAAQLDHTTLDLLCSRVFDVDILDDRGRTPLYVACVEGRDAQGQTDVKALCEIIKLLSSAGANPNVVDSDGLSPLHFIAASLQFDAVHALLKAKAFVNATAANESAWTPLHYACACCPIKTAFGEGHRTLNPCETSIMPNEEDSDNNDTRERIYISDLGRTIGKLLEHGAWPNLRAGKTKCSPLQLLVQAKGLGDPLFELAAQLLITSGARIDETIGPASKNLRFVELREELVKCHEEWTRRAPIDATSLALW